MCHSVCVSVFVCRYCLNCFITSVSWCFSIAYWDYFVCVIKNVSVFCRLVNRSTNVTSTVYNSSRVSAFVVWYCFNCVVAYASQSVFLFWYCFQLYCRVGLCLLLLCRFVQLQMGNSVSVYFSICLLVQRFNYVVMCVSYCFVSSYNFSCETVSQCISVFVGTTSTVTRSLCICVCL